jgi:hypothetical protein
MSLTVLLGKTIPEIKEIDPAVGFELFADKTQQNNHSIEKPPKYQIAVPASIGILLGISIAYFSRNGGSQ